MLVCVEACSLLVVVLAGLRLKEFVGGIVPACKLSVIGAVVYRRLLLTVGQACVWLPLRLRVRMCVF